MIHVRHTNIMNEVLVFRIFLTISVYTMNDSIPMSAVDYW